MKRREFITLLGGASAAWPLAARAQQPERMRLIGVLMSTAEGNRDREQRFAVFTETMQKLGWTIGRNIRIDYRSASGDADRLRAMARDLAALVPDVIVTPGSPATAAMLAASPTIPIVFVGASDPLGSGLVTSFGRPGGNVTGFTNYEFSIGSKWLELLKEIAPKTERVMMLSQPGNMGNAGLLQAAQLAAPKFGLQTVAAPVLTAADIEGAFDRSAKTPNTGLLALPSASISDNQELIVTLAARYRVPAIYATRSIAARGGLIYYGIDDLGLYREAATYVDRIFRGAKVGELPVQQPTKYELVINLKTAKALGLDVPAQLQQLADEVIE
jgi:putative tryptophan/tyrosine transport system substrate-binding protein